MTPIKALFVEDEPDIQFIVQLALGRAEQFDLTTFDSGVLALDALSGAQNIFDLALVNYSLPSMTGMEFIKRLKKFPSFEDIPVIFVTAMQVDKVTVGMEEPDFLGVISKPFDAIALPRTIQQLLSTR